MIRFRYLALLALMSLAACGDDPRPMVKLLANPLSSPVSIAGAAHADELSTHAAAASKEMLPAKDPHYPGDETRPEWREGMKFAGGEVVAYNDRDAEHTVGPRSGGTAHSHPMPN